MRLGLFRQQSGGPFEFTDGLGIFSERQQAGTQEQAGGSLIRLKSKRLAKSRDSLGVIPAQQSNDSKIVIDERVSDTLPQGKRKSAFSRNKIA